MGSDKVAGCWAPWRPRKLLSLVTSFPDLNAFNSRERNSGDLGGLFLAHARSIFKAPQMVLSARNLSPLVGCGAD